MGLDLSIVVVGAITAEHYDKAKAFIEARYPGDKYTHWEHTEKGVEFWDGTRWYGKGYERGNWGYIYGLTRTFMAAFPQCAIYHLADGGFDDVSPNHEPVTEASLQETWDYYLSKSGLNYHRTRALIKGEK